MPGLKQHQRHACVRLSQADRQIVVPAVTSGSVANYGFVLTLDERRPRRWLLGWLAPAKKRAQWVP
jgi:hypothetical protein